MRRRRFRFIERTWKRHSNCLSGYASRRIARRNDETDCLPPGTMFRTGMPGRNCFEGGTAGRRKWPAECSPFVFIARSTLDSMWCQPKERVEPHPCCSVRVLAGLAPAEVRIACSDASSEAQEVWACAPPFDFGGALKGARALLAARRQRARLPLSSCVPSCQFCERKLPSQEGGHVHLEMSGRAPAALA